MYKLFSLVQGKYLAMINFWILVCVFISLSLFYYYNQKAKIRREERRDLRKEKHEEYLDSLLKNLKESNSQDETSV